MAKTRASVASSKGKVVMRDMDSYSITGTNKVVRAGDCVLMRQLEANKLPYVARVDKIETDGRNNVNVHIRWYYRPEETKGGRRQFHGSKELFISNHCDVQSANTIEGKCIVHTFKNYTKLDSVGPEDYYCRFEFQPLTNSYIPDRVAVYCTCEMPYNPDELMVQCEACKDWYHPACVGLTVEEAKKLPHFICTECTGEFKKQNGLASSPTNSRKVEAKRRRK